MNELSLFTGAGGGLLGTMLLGWHPVGYVEWDDYCQRVISARIRDGYLPDAPIFGDIRSFVDQGYAASYSGLVDVITGGFPCQPFSVAGKQRGAADERNMWPSMAECIGIVRPRFVLLENVPGIRPYLPVVVRDLRRLGYEVSRPLLLGANDVGAPHRRKRVWIVANTVSTGTGDFCGTIGADRRRYIWRYEQAFRQAYRTNGSDRFEPTSSIETDVADTDCKYGFRGSKRQFANSSSGSSRDKSQGCCSWWDNDPADVPDAETTDRRRTDREDNGRRGDQEARGQDFGDDRTEYRPTESRLGRVVDELAVRLDKPGPAVKGPIPRVAKGVKDRVNRLKAIGNGQVSLCVAVAWKILSKLRSWV